MWSEPNQAEIRAALEGWRGSTGVTMTNIRIERKDTEKFGDHYFVQTDYEKDGEEVGRCRLRYCADGTAYLEHVYLEPEVARTGVMGELLADFQQHYRDWGLTVIRNPTPVEAGVRFAQSQGFEPVGGDTNLHERAVDPE